MGGLLKRRDLRSLRGLHVNANLTKELAAHGKSVVLAGTDQRNEALVIASYLCREEVFTLLDIGNGVWRRELTEDGVWLGRRSRAIPIAERYIEMLLYVFVYAQ